MLATYPENLSQNFTLSQLTATSYPFDNTPTDSAYKNLKKLAQALERIREEIGPFAIASGYRSKAVNDAVGGATNSRHTFGDAVDISPLHERAESYWAKILANDSLKNLFGEIAWKKHQTNAIHLSLPFWKGIEYVKASPRIADLYSGAVVYVRQSPEQVMTYLVKHGLRPDPYAMGPEAPVFVPTPTTEVTSLPSVISAPAEALKTVAKAASTPVGLAALALGGGFLILALGLRQRKPTT